MATKKMYVMEEVEAAKKQTEFVEAVKQKFADGHYVKQGDRYEFSMTKEYCRLEMDIIRNKRGLFDTLEDVTIPERVRFLFHFYIIFPEVIK